MKIKMLSLAVALAASGNAMAFVPWVDAPDYHVDMAGATASTDTMRKVVIDNVCDGSAPIDVFVTNGNHWAVACQYSGATATANVLITKADSGSGYGVVHVDEQLGVETIDVNATDCSATGTGDTGSRTYNAYNCVVDIPATIVPDFGVSDVEPGMFTGSLAPTFSGVAVDYKNVSNMVVKPLSGLSFGVVVTLDLYKALQAAQFESTSVCYPANAGYSAANPAGPGVVGDSEACMPSLSGQEIRSLFTGKMPYWDYVIDSTGTDLTSIAAAAGVTAPTDTTVRICRRRQGSGTHATTAAVFLQTNCTPGTATMLSATSTGAPLVAAAKGSSDLGKCLHDLQAGFEEITYTGDEKFTDYGWGIGYQSTEKNADLAHDYRFVKVDGFAPTLENIFAGDYEDFSESTMQRRGSNSYNASVTGSALGNMSSDVTDIFDTIALNLASAANLIATNDDPGFRHPWGQGGWLANPAAGNIPDLVLDIAANPTNMMTHSVGGNPNTCQKPVVDETYGSLIVD